MSTELTVLLLSTGLGLLHIVLQASAATAKIGVKANLSPRDDVAPPSGIAGRLDRASNNFRETWAFFAVLVIVATIANKTSSVTSTASIVYLVARALYLPVYAAGIPGIRTALWLVATISIVVLGGSLLG